MHILRKNLKPHFKFDMIRKSRETISKVMVSFT
jgi:hypothetical protein